MRDRAKCTLWPRDRHGVCRQMILAYDASDPWAVTLRVCTLHGPRATCCARELLRAGLTEPTGHGAVHVMPIGDDYVQIELPTVSSGPLHAMKTSVTRFLRQTDTLVPPGSEWIDWDRVVEELIA